MNPFSDTAKSSEVLEAAIFCFINSKRQKRKLVIASVGSSHNGNLCGH